MILSATGTSNHKTLILIMVSLAMCMSSASSSPRHENKSSFSIRGASNNARDTAHDRNLGVKQSRQYHFNSRKLMMNMMGMGKSSSKSRIVALPPDAEANNGFIIKKPVQSFVSNTQEYQFTLINQAFQQPFSSFFVMVHNNDALPLYIRGEKASEPLAILAENGNPQPLVDMYTGLVGVKDAFIHDNNGNGPLFGGGRTTFTVSTSAQYPYVTIASMAINTNDCFVSINGMRFFNDREQQKAGAEEAEDNRVVLDLDGLDAGSEENNELCSSIPGPDCPEGSGNTRDGNGEGFVHVHRGFFGIGGDLSEAGYDWRNPMMRVIVTAL